MSDRPSGYAAVRYMAKPRSDRQDRPCPKCGRPSAAYKTRYLRKEWVQDRICLSGHRWIWNNATGRPLRESRIPEPRTRVCLFTDCGRPTAAEWARRRGIRMTGYHSSLCQGHAKQKERKGWAALTPLRGPHGRRP